MPKPFPIFSIRSHPNTAAGEAMAKRKLKNHGSDRTPLVKRPSILRESDLDEIKRLMKRKIAPGPKSYLNKCLVCLGERHRAFNCPWFKKVPEGAVVGPGYDVACSGCGRIGETCCAKGSHAVRKRCGFCVCAGHWFWEDKCRDPYPGPHARELWNSFKKALMEEDSSMLQSKKRKEDDKGVVVDDEDKGEHCPVGYPIMEDSFMLLSKK